MYTYDRRKAINWALRNATAQQPFASSCAWFISQALWEGGLPQTDEWFWPEPLESTDMHVATKSHLLARYLVEAGLATEEVVFHPDYQPEGIDAQVGDVLVYDWDGCLHMALITVMRQGGDPVVSEWGVAGRSSLRSSYAYRPWLWSQNGGRPVVDIHPNQTVLLLRMR